MSATAREIELQLRDGIRAEDALLVRALRAELQVEETRAMLRLECAEYDANDWPDDLYLPDVVEKHLARQARLAIQEAESREERAMSLLADVAGSGVEHDDLRIGYVTVQIDRVMWEAVKRCVGDMQ